jgi:hypothetical protein
MTLSVTCLGLEGKNAAMARPDKGLPCPARAVFGSKNPAAKLCEDAVLWIRGSSEACRFVAKVFGVAPSTVSAIRRRDTWRHLEG